MAITLFPDGLPCTLKEPFDLSFLHQWGTVFHVFDRLDSGNLCFGLEQDGHRFFLKFAGAKTLGYTGDPQEAMRRLELSAQVYRDLAHPTLLPLLWNGPVSGGYGLLFPWTDALCMGKQYPSRQKFLSLPLNEKLAIFHDILLFHLHVAERGYVSIDFYDGCILYDPMARKTLLCDVDAYHKTPFQNPIGRMWGSARFMAPEEFQKGAPIDEITMVYTMGATVFALFAQEGSQERSCWPLSERSWKFVKKCVSPQREERVANLQSFLRGWEDSLG